MAAKDGNKKPGSAAKRKGPTASHGGARPNPGPKPGPVARTIAEINAATMAGLIEWLPGLLNNLKTLADGGYERVEETFEDVEGLGILSARKRVVSIAEPDRAANQYLVDRLLGKPKQAVEMSGPDGGAIQHSVMIYLPSNGRDADGASDPPPAGPPGSVAG